MVKELTNSVELSTAREATSCGATRYNDEGTNYLCGAEYRSRGHKLCSHSVEW
jgi:hypothetical protein